MKHKFPSLLVLLILLVLVKSSLNSGQRETSQYLWAITPQPCGSFSNTSQNFTWTPGACDAGHRFKVTVTVTDAAGRTASSTKYLNVRGACTLYVSDLDLDWKVTIRDAATVALAWMTRQGDRQWNPAADLDGNGLVNIADIACLALYYPQTIPQF